MKTIIATIALLGTISAPAFALQPIPGSITYGGSQYGQLAKSPVGSAMTNDFYSNGQHYVETYVVGPDHKLKLIERSQKNSN
ncbi:hypothetical protein [Martelella endophytica]|uniref:Uncharacterized protein n=1 Tax=Martelella endophytica TaxID=1486262 RepID=A0A0D5LPL3_MAREN|nr:hypothetical protein [Martelella endophytica]AJY45855.1 hypothetical protein TM49_09470 [Martelella endophytica]